MFVECIGSLHCPSRIAALKDWLFSAAFDVTAERVEYGLNTEIPTPTAFITSFAQHDIVALVHSRVWWSGDDENVLHSPNLSCLNDVCV